MSEAIAILEFWFGNPESVDYGKPRKDWFSKEPGFDAEIRNQFFQDYQEAASGLLDDWIESPESCLALILLLDQFPRNMFRGKPEAFATDWEALTIAQQAVSRGYDRQLLPAQRWFIYLPFSHSENLQHQLEAIRLFKLLTTDPNSVTAIESAVQHMQIIQRFGRFPHRNAILGRPSNPEEKDFLKGSGSSF
jgi:uncharacterized protein (DUF924 family)